MMHCTICYFTASEDAASMVSHATRCSKDRFAFLESSDAVSPLPAACASCQMPQTIGEMHLKGCPKAGASARILVVEDPSADPMSRFVDAAQAFLKEKNDREQAEFEDSAPLARMLTDHLDAYERAIANGFKALHLGHQIQRDLDAYEQMCVDAQAHGAGTLHAIDGSTKSSEEVPS